MTFERCVKMARVNLDEGFDTTATAYAVQALEALAKERKAEQEVKAGRVYYAPNGEIVPTIKEVCDAAAAFHERRLRVRLNHMNALAEPAEPVSVQPRHWGMFA